MYLRAMQWRRGSLIWLPLVFVAVGVFGLFARFDEPVLYLFLLLFGITVFVLRPLLARRQIRTNKLLHDPRSGTADENGLTSSTSHGTVTIAWSDYHRASIAPDFVLLYLSTAMYHLVPRSFFDTDAAWSEFCALVRAHVRLRRRNPPWVIAFWCLILIAIPMWLLLSSL